MQFCVLGINHKTASVEIREQLSFHDSEISKAYELLMAKDEIEECVILSTCNRVEIYSILNNSRINVIRDFIRDFHKFGNCLDDIIYTKSGYEAVLHICMVASGLDSMALGEPQVFGQVKNAFAKAKENNAVGYALEYLFAQVFSIVKKVRSKTGIGHKNVSVSYIAVKLAQTIFEKINGKKVLILGAGETGELTVRNLISIGIKDVIVANRTFHKAVELAEKFNGIPVMIHEVKEYIEKIDIIISSVSGYNFVLNKNDIEQVTYARNNMPIFIVDISVPRSIDPQIGLLKNVHLYNIDDLQNVVKNNWNVRFKEAQKGIELIKQKVPVIEEEIRTYDIVPTLVSLRSKAEEIRKEWMIQNVEKIGVNEKQREQIDTMVKAMVNKILKHSEIRVREYTKKKYK